jgi:hypothetical protein
MYKEVKLSFKKFVILALIPFFMIMVSWAGDELYNIFFLKGDFYNIRACCIIFGAGLLYILIYRNRYKFISPYNRSKTKSYNRVKHLVLILSMADEALTKKYKKCQCGNLKAFLNKLLKENTKKKQDGKIWNWEMPLIAINHHKKSLKAVTLVCSKKIEEVKGSIDQVEEFYNICKKYSKIKFFVAAQKPGYSPELLELPKDIKEYDGFDFNDFDRLIECYDFILSEFKKGCKCKCTGKKEKFSYKETAIDITGGQKPTSIAAASATFNKGVLTQYVDTNTKEPIAYDLRGGYRLPVDIG